MPEKDYSTISPSAKALLFMKGVTDIPFAREAAALMMAPGVYEPDMQNDDMRFWARVLHFEQRYKSINQLLADVPVKNILELSSGFSFRGLALTGTQENVHYIDTDLPGIIETKQSFTEALGTGKIKPGSKLETLPLNVLDEAQFRAIVDRFEEGPVVIVNEGLLMYLDLAEKEKLCSIIHAILKERGGYWITADVYTQTMMHMPPGTGDDALNQFLAEHRTEEKKFDGFGAAAAFFNHQRLIVDKVEVRNREQLVSYRYFMDKVPKEQLQFWKGSARIRETWRLQPI